MKRLYQRARDAALSASARNIFYVGSVQIISLLIPVITLPWILRALQPAAYGSYALALAFGQYMVTLVDYGFFLAATQRVALIRDDPKELSRYFWTVQSARIFLALMSLFIGMALILLVPQFRTYASVMFANMPVVLGTLLYPQWLFLGLERIKAASLANIVGRIITTIPIFLFVKSPGDAPLAAFLSACNAIATGVIAALLIARWKLVEGFVRPRWAGIVAAYRDAWPLFVASIGVSLYSGSNTVVLGLVGNKYEVGVFNAADKARSVAGIPVSAATQVFYPRVGRLMVENRAKAIVLVVKIGGTLGLLMGFVSAILFIGAPLIVDVLMGRSYQGATTVLRILAIVPFLISVNTVMAQLVMLNQGMKHEVSRIIMFCGVVNVLMLLILARVYGAEGAATSLAATETLVTALMAWRLHAVGFFRDVKEARRG